MVHDQQLNQRLKKLYLYMWNYNFKFSKRTKFWTKRTLEIHVKYIITKNNFMYENLYPIKCIFNFFFTINELLTCTLGHTLIWPKIILARLKKCKQFFIFSENKLLTILLKLNYSKFWHYSLLKIKIVTLNYHPIFSMAWRRPYAIRDFQPKLIDIIAWIYMVAMVFPQGKVVLYLDENQGQI